eukprot:gene9011-1341_t
MSDDKEENIKVVLRVRPLVDSGDNDNNTVKCLHHENDTAVRVDSHSKIFNFDQVLHECISQFSSQLAEVSLRHASKDTMEQYLHTDKLEAGKRLL